MTPEAVQTTTRPVPSWVVPSVVAALVLGVAGLGVGIYAVATMPGKTSGPRGAMGPTGAKGDQGLQGATGAVGPAGPAGAAGPAGTLASATVVSGAALTSAPNPPVGTVLVGKTSCPADTVMLTGSAQVTAKGTIADRNVELRTSLPIAPNIWQTVALVTGPLGSGMAMTMQPYVVCGVAAKVAPTTTIPKTTTTVPPT